MDLSIIVPTLNEERALEANLEHLCAISSDVVISDGGSSDRTEEIARRFPVSWLTGSAGRGAQLNRGAAAASGDTLLFVHADTRLPAKATDLVSAAIEAGAVGGGFEVSFASRRPIMALGSRLVNLRTRLGKVPLGDQAQFVRRDTFRQLGGYRAWPILEDLDFMRRLKRYGEVAILRPAVVTSDRRFAQRGIVRTLATNYLIWGLYAVGVHPERLARLYRQVR